MDKIFLIDGSSMLSTQFFATLPFVYTMAKTDEAKEEASKKVMQTKDGIYTNAVYGMTKALLKLIRDENPDYLAVCWDISQETFRRKLYPGYKAHRSKKDPKLSDQFNIMQKTLEYIGIPTFSLDNFEADDLIGTIAKKMSETSKVIILTKDQDALQLIDDNVTVWLNTKAADKMIEEYAAIENLEKQAPFNHFPFNAKAFEHFYGLQPKQIIDLKSIDGDKSDGIPGIPGYGAKGVTPLLAHFGTIEYMYHYIRNNEPKAIEETFKTAGIKRIKAEKLLEFEEQVILSKKLATIECGIEEYVQKDKEEYRLKIDNEKMKKMFERLEFNSLI